jgi:hypothetical protein
MDRITDGAHIIETGTESYRFRMIGSKLSPLLTIRSHTRVGRAYTAWLVHG